MASADQYADWIVKNQAKKGTPEFETVAQAYKLARDETPTASPDASASMQGAALERANLGGAAQFGLNVLHGASGMTRGAAKLGPGDDAMYDIPGADPNSGGALLGALMDPLAAATGAGAAKAVPYAKVLGGTFGQGIKAVAKNTGAGAATGATVGGVVGSDDRQESAGTGAVIGALLNQALPPGLRILGKGIASVAGKFNTKDRAANLLRDVVGADKDAMSAAAAAAPAGQTAAQAVSGIHNDLVPALESLARNKDIESFFSKLDVTQRNAILAELRGIAGGSTQTAARQTAKSSREALNEATGSMREQELEAANLAGKLLPRLEAQAERLGDAASSKVADVRRLETAKALAEQRANSGAMSLATPEPTGQPRVPGRYAYGDELAERAEGASQQAADDSLILGAGARDARMRADSLAANGLTPLDTTGVIHRIDRLLNDPATGANKVNQRALMSVRNQIQEWTDKGKGVIDAKALYEIRKSAVNDAIEKLLPNSDPKAQSQRAAGLLAYLKPAIDGAIEAAGGTGWRKYLEAYEQGARKITEQKVGAKALDLFEKSPGKFESFAAGNEPDMVRKITKNPKEFDVNEALGERGRDVVTRAATEVTRNRGIKEAATRGEGGLAEVLKGHTASFKLPNFLNPKISVANRSLEIVENAVNQKTMAEVYAAMRSGQSFEELLNRVPTSERMAVVRALMAASNKGLPATGGIVSATESPR